VNHAKVVRAALAFTIVALSRYAEPIAHGLTRRLARSAVRSEPLALDHSTRDPARTSTRIGADQERTEAGQAIAQKRPEP
jgi:hypothetical protein